MGGQEGVWREGGQGGRVWACGCVGGQEGGLVGGGTWFRHHAPIAPRQLNKDAWR